MDAGPIEFVEIRNMCHSDTIIDSTSEIKRTRAGDLDKINNLIYCEYGNAEYKIARLTSVVMRAAR